MPSSVIRYFRYDRARETLTITFQSGRIYAYFGVPPLVAAAFRAAPSKGIFFNQTIRDRFPYREVAAAG
jgi:hypothetical protein